MTSFLNRCIWNPTAGGLTDFVVASAFTGGYTPAQCLDPVVTDGATYHYFAQTADNTQHEEGDGVYHVGTSTLTRALIRNSSSSGAKVNFGQVPIVTMGSPTALDIPTNPAGPNGAVQFDNSGSFGGFGVYTPSTHTLQFDAADSASPASQTIAFQSVAAGTLNTTVPTASIQGPLSTGIGGIGGIAFYTGFQGIDNAYPIVSISQGSPAVITTSVQHNLFFLQTVLLSTTGTLPAPFQPLTTYWVDPTSLGTTTFELAATRRGTPINTTTAGSGTHSYVPGAVCTVSGSLFTSPNNNLIPGMQLQFQSTGTLPTPLQPNTNYFVRFGDNQNQLFDIAATPFGNVITTSGGSGTLTYQIQGGTTQNLSPSNSIFFGPAQAYNTDSNRCLSVVQQWNSSNPPAGGLLYNITNINFDFQDTIYNTFVANVGTTHNLEFATPVGAASWRIRQKSPNTNYIDFNASNATTISGTPVVFTAASQYPAQTTQTGNYSHALTDRTLVFNGAGSITLTLLAAVTYPGLELWVKTIANQTVVSASSNVIPQAGGAAGTAILAATAGKFALLKSNGANWEIIASN